MWIWIKERAKVSYREVRMKAEDRKRWKNSTDKNVVLVLNE